MASSIKLTLRKDKLNNQGLNPIHFRITKNRKSSYISPGQYIRESEWDVKNKRVKTNHKNSGRLSAKMTEYMRGC